MPKKKWEQDLVVQFKDGQVIEVTMHKGDRLILQTDHVLSERMKQRIFNHIKSWLHSEVPVLIIESGIKLAVVRTLNYVES
jgi:hypothetical protein